MDKPLVKNSAYKKGSQQESFLRAQEAWNEIYGRAISDKRNWRTMCFILSLLLLGAIAGITWQGTQSKVVPYVVVLDKAGQEIHTGKAVKTTTLDEKIFKQEIVSFVKKTRLATVDRQLMKQNVDWVYAHLLPNTSAYKKLNNFFRETNPFELVKTKTRIVTQVSSILPVTNNTWSVEWVETLRNISDGEVAETARHKAIITVSKKDPETEKQWDHNPFGIWIIDIEWEKKS